jgi:hypothetical protein
MRVKQIFHCINSFFDMPKYSIDPPDLEIRDETKRGLSHGEGLEAHKVKDLKVIQSFAG